MIIPKFCNKFNKSRSSVTKQRNKYIKTLKNAKKQYFNYLNSKNITDRTFKDIPDKLWSTRFIYTLTLSQKF